MIIKSPPGFCEGRPHLFVELELHVFPKGSEVALIPVGMGVDEQLHEFYWAEVATYGGMIEAGVKFEDFIVFDDAGKRVRAGSVPDWFGPHEIAWLNCMFVERQLGRAMWLQPDDLSPEVIAAVRKVKGAEMRGPCNV